ncbi:S-layer homology domain-containing protein [Paenibacillus typhae]|uniref:S-layer homology domain-containing protein n=1 Tax=Paenibacillus typhae TaxID=1174501 RepID=UPI001C8DA021|nr:S-layer homology domain-containing protein [Paenibacillus typhae]MBY0008828.1 S-layer homology domain-containing protein [Paenibacillus typhae]
MNFKRAMSLGLKLCLVLSIVWGAGSVSAAQSNDYEGHWAQKQIEKWLQQGYLKGSGDGSVRPDEAITRAEFVALTNRMWGITAGKPAEFSDLPESSWAYAEFSKAMSAGYIEGYEGKVRPNGLITRQEAAVIISRLLLLEDPSSAEVLSVFTDYNEIADWSKLKVAAMVNIDAMKGYPNGSFRPNQPMTRAESITLLDIFNTVSCGIGDLRVTGPGEVGGCSPSEIKTFRNVTVSAPDVILKNMIVKGDLLLDSSTGEGVITLNNVTVEGKLIVQGAGTALKLQKSSISLLLVGQGAEGFKADFDGSTVIGSMTVDAASAFTGSGTVQTVTVNDGGKGSTFAVKPLEVKGSQKNSIVVDGVSHSAGLPLLSGIVLTQGEEYRYSNAGSALLSLEGLPSDISAAVHRPGYYFSRNEETVPDPANPNILMLPPSSQRYSFAVKPEHSRDYMTIILYDVNNKPLGYQIIKLDLHTARVTLNEPVIRFNEGVTISREFKSNAMIDRISISAGFAAGHPELKYYTFASNTYFDYISEGAKSFTVKDVSSQIQLLNRLTDVMYSVPLESLARSAVHANIASDFRENYMIVFYDKDFNVKGYYESPAIVTDQQAADTVAYLINQLPAVSAVTLNNEQAVNWAYKRYSGLTEAQKKLLDEAAAAKIIALKSAVEQLKKKP